MPTALVNGIEVYFEEHGRGPRLLFLNGSGATLTTSRLLIDPFTDRFDTVAHDQRGLGRTAIPPGPYRMADYPRDAAALLDHLGWSTCRMVGVSFGGMVAQELAVTWPERVERLALCCTSPGGAGGSSYPLHELVAVPADEHAAVMTTLLDTRFTPAWLAEHHGDRQLVATLAARGGTPKPAAVLRGEAEQLAARLGHDVFDRLPAIDCPTLVASGRYDSDRAARERGGDRGTDPDAQLRVYDGGHAYFVQDAAALPDLLDFLSG